MRLPAAAAPSARRAPVAAPAGERTYGVAPDGWLTAAAHYLEPGPRNRLYLSLRSGIPSQVDWALARLAAYTQQLGDRFLLSEYPGLADALLELVRRLARALQGRPRAEWDADLGSSCGGTGEEEPGATTPSGWLIDVGVGASAENPGAGLLAISVAGARRKRRRALCSAETAQRPAALDVLAVPTDAALLRRASEAVLILRNLSLSARNVPPLLQASGVLQTVYEVLAVCAAHETTALDEFAELADVRTNAFDMLEALCPHLVLSDWVRAQYATSAPGAPARDAARTEDRVFQLVFDTLHTTQDRALLLASLRCMSALATCESNAPVFLEADTGGQLTRLGLVARCVALLPLTQDVELIEAATDLLYQVVATNENALVLGALEEPPQHTRGVLRYLLRNLSMGKTVWERDSRLTVNYTAWWNAHVPSAQRAQQWLERTRREEQERARAQALGVAPGGRALPRALTAAEHGALSALGEPERGVEWMKLVFEADSQGEVTQMEFWTAYRDEFTPDLERGGAALQPAANLIRNVSQTFPGAAAMVISPPAGGQPRFIIRGISHRAHVEPPWQCRWAACPAPQADGPAAVQAHLAEHVRLAPDTRCRWGACGHASDSRPELERHARTHLAVPPPADGAPRAVSGPPASGTVDNPGVITFEVERTPSVPPDVPGGAPSPYGVAFTSLLVVRFVTRAAASVLDRAGVSRPSQTYGGEVIARRSSADELFGCPVPPTAAEESTSAPPGTTERQLQLARRVMDAVCAVEEDLVEYALCNDILCRYVNDTLVAIRPGAPGVGAEAPPGEAPSGEAPAGASPAG